MAKAQNALAGLTISKKKIKKGLPKRCSNPRKKARHKECWERGQARKAARREVQESARKAKLDN